jgi:hypothetical protein
MKVYRGVEVYSRSGRFISGKKSRYSLIGRLGRSQSRSGLRWEGKYFLFLPGFETRIVHLLA